MFDNNSNIILIAQTQYKESWQTINLKFCIQYAIMPLHNENDKDLIVNKYGMREVYRFYNPYVALRRRVDNLNEVINNWEWELIDVRKNNFEAVLSFGDSSFYDNSTIGLDPLYQLVMDYCNKSRILKNELQQLEDNITPNKFQQKSNFELEYENKYIQELKDHRLYSKAMKDNAPKDIIDSIKNLIKIEMKNEYNRITNRIEAIKSELAELEEMRNL